MSSNIDAIFVLADTINGRKNRVIETRKVEIIRTWTPDNALSLLNLIPHILQLKPDLIHFNIHFQSFGRSRIVNFIGFSLIFLLKLFRLKVLVTAHNLGDKVDLAKVNLKPGIVNRVGIFVATKCLLRANRVVVLVRSYIEHLKLNHGYRRTVYIAHGSPLRDGPFQVCGGNPEKKILFFGHMAPHKGLPVLLAAFKELCKERYDVKLVIAGTNHPNFDGYIETMGEITLPSVEVLGYIQERDVEALFESSDIVVLPYLTCTGTSGVFHLACGFGKPIVASDLPEIRELVSEGASAALVEPGNPSDLKKAILNLLDNHERLIEMSQQNLAYASTETWDKIAEAYEKTYLQLVYS